MSGTITYKYSANYETKENGETYIISRNGVLRVPRLIKVVEGIAEVMTDYTMEQQIHNTIKMLLSEGAAVPFDYTVHSDYDSDEYRNMLTGEMK